MLLYRNWFVLEVFCPQSTVFVHISLLLWSQRSVPTCSGRERSCCCCSVLAQRGKVPGYPTANRPTINLHPFFLLFPPTKKININNQWRQYPGYVWDSNYILKFMSLSVLMDITYIIWSIFQSVRTYNLYTIVIKLLKLD